MNTYCPSAIETRWVTYGPEDSPVSGLYGRAPNGDLMNSQGQILDRQQFAKVYEAWDSDKTK